MSLNNIIESDMLKSISLSHISKGILFKWTTVLEEKLNTMIILDYIINNTDRHLNNFGFREESNGNISGMSKIFDNGNSLYCDLSIDDIKSILNNPIRYKRFDKAKPFKSKHSKQIKIIKTYLI